MASERGRKKGKESGGKEGSGGGDGEGDSGKDPSKCAKGDDGKGFNFWKTPEGERSAEGGANGSPMASIRKGAPLFSYRDKLLSPGGAGFLVQHSEDDDITQGWKDYFHKMNEKDSQCDLDESDDEENLETRRMEGKPGKLKFTAEEIGNMIGKMIKVDRSTSIYDKGGFARICVEIDLKKPLLPSYLVFGEERSIIYEGLHQVCFECGQYGHQKSVCPTKLSQPNMPVYEHGTETSNVGGDGENNVEKGVEQGSAKAKVGGEDNSNVAKGVGGRNQSAGGDGVGKDGLSTPENATKLAGRKNSVSGGVVADGNLFGKLKILRRDFRGHLNVIDAKEVIPGSPSVTVERINVEPSKDNQQDHGRSESRMSIKNSKNTLNKDKGAQKGEWVQVGSKRKSEGKGRLKGKENKPPARNRVHRISSLGQGLEPTKSNSFDALQDMEAQLSETISMDQSNPMNSIGDSKTEHQDGQELLDVGVQALEKDMAHKQQVDETMSEQDKAEGEAAIPQHPSTVSQ
ncbi:hypothetical protein K1719_013343 [Acacia pycnantha]|nr:hypothetical protein K1719_013343 [Acacia pycnantha]